jgi:hypothetical protein
MPSLEAGKKLSVKQAQRKHSAWVQFAKLAAVIALIAVSVYAVNNWNNNTPDETPTQIVSKKPVTTGHSTNELSQATTPSSLISNKKKPETSSQEDPEVNNDHLDKVAQKSTVIQTTAEIPDILNEENTGGLSEIQQDTDQVLDLTVPSQPRPKVTITYKKSSDPPEPTLAIQSQGETRSRMLKKLWTKAQNINFNEVSLASIRGTKDELLAIDRKSKPKESKSN